MTHEELTTLPPGLTTTGVTTGHAEASPLWTGLRPSEMEPEEAIEVEPEAAVEPEVDSEPTAEPAPEPAK